MSLINLCDFRGLSAAALISYPLLVNAQPHVEYVQNAFFIARDGTVSDGTLSGVKTQHLEDSLTAPLVVAVSLCKMHLLTVCLADGLVRAELVGAAGVAC